ncbi:hypothetical protein I3842_07G118300 [Carya illinoinensis]|uniref:Uncharacterized protein n=1 Tax=Carya illinoinensis TaxID=32201 RepID=A0A922JH61_CARIL|nr:hypothetical protein I3842_07G118300 [Carya illinoinensis]
MKLPSFLAIFSAFSYVMYSRGSPCICTQKINIFKLISCKLELGGQSLTNIWKPLMFHGLCSRTLSFSCYVGKVKRNVLTWRSSIASPMTKLHSALMVACSAFLFSDFEEMIFPIRTCSDKCVAKAVSGLVLLVFAVSFLYLGVVGMIVSVSALRDVCGVITN